MLPFQVDIHSHLIPAVDDGVQSVDESLAILREMSELGYKKVVTTPHTMKEAFPNTSESILNGLAKMKKAIAEAQISIELEAASEYYLDESFIEKLDNDEPLLTFGDKYLLFETSFINEPPFLKEATFKMTIKGYKPVYAHPERYLYLMQNEQLIEEMIDRSVYFQLNLVSLSGCYSKPVQKLAEKLIDAELVRFVGTDCHNMGHIDFLKQAINTKHFKKLANQKILNNSLL